MKSRTYYGEYSLKHWIELMLKKNIELPEYQRSFVWKKEDCERLIKSMREGQFIQPITLAFYENGGNKQNLILDGQQRLTSILLAFIGLFPDKTQFEHPQTLSSDDDSANTAEGDAEENNDIEESENYCMEWTFTEIVKFGKSKDEIIDGMTERDKVKYQDFPVGCDDSFFDNTFLGFSYIVPSTDDSLTKQTFFTKLFRNMNYLGKKLLPIESRRSLYYVKNDLKNYFEGKVDDNTDVLCGITLLENMTTRQIDFVRYLSILSQYSIVGERKDKVLVGYSAYSQRENYYSDYVAYVVGIDQEDRTDKFDNFDIETVFPNHCWQTRFAAIKRKIDVLSNRMNLDSRRRFTSWIDADYWLFGLIYWMLFKNKDINANETLITTLQNTISSKRLPGSYSQSPNLLRNIRDRLEHSIEIYHNNIVEP